MIDDDTMQHSVELIKAFADALSKAPARGQ
jgi:hypothetical protein